MSSSPPAALPPSRPANPSASAPPRRTRPSRLSELFAAWRAGDARAGEVLFRDLRAMLVAMFRDCPPHAIDDLIQDTFVACVMARTALRHDEAFPSYVRCVARRALIRHRHRTRPLHGLEDDTVADPLTVSALEDTLELHRRLARHRSPHDSLVAMRYLQGHPGVAIASMLRVSEATVRRRIQRELEELRH